MFHDKEKLQTATNAELLQWRLSLLNPYESKEKVDHYRIRGHHLLIYFKLYKGHTPFDVAEHLIDDKKAREFFGDWYGDDVIGTNNRDYFIYTTLAQHDFQKFVDLPPETAVMIDSNRDGICNNCKVGEHCTTNGTLGEIYDSTYIAGLIKSSEESGLNINDNLDIRFRYVNLPTHAILNKHTPISISVLTTKKFLDEMLTTYARSNSTILELSDNKYYNFRSHKESQYREFVRNHDARI